MTRSKKLTDLEFYVPVWTFRNKMEYRNIFQSLKVLRSVACYRKGEYDKLQKLRKGEPKGSFRKPLEQWAFYCFNSMWSRVEWEFGFGEPFKNNDGTWDGEKTDVFTAFILPNAKLLKQMIDGVSLNSCNEWLREENKRYKRYRKVLNETFGETAES